MIVVHFPKHYATIREGLPTGSTFGRVRRNTVLSLLNRYNTQNKTRFGETPRVPGFGFTHDLKW